MIRGRGWTGFEAAALQEAMRQSVREFAARLGVESTTVNNWRSGLSAVTPRPEKQAILDTTYAKHATPEDRARFEQIVAEGEAAWRSRHRGSRGRTPAQATLARRSEGDGSAPTPDGGSHGRKSPAIAQLCDVLTDYGFSQDRLGARHKGPLPSIERLEHDLDAAFVAYQRSHFTASTHGVALLLADIELVSRECRESERARLGRVLALAYQAAASVLVKAGEVDLAWIASERGLSAADVTGSLVVRGSLIRSVAFSLLATGRFEPAMNLVESGAQVLEVEAARNDRALSVYGTLLLVGSMAAARFGDRSRTVAFLDEANGAAHRLRGDANHLWTSFGPTNVAIHRVNTAAELGDIKSVLGSAIDLNSAPVERRVRYLLDVARTHSLVGNADDALDTMLAAERMAPEHVRQHYLSRKVVATLAHEKVYRSVELGRLTRRVNTVELI